MPICPYCKEPAQLVTGAEVYRHRPDLARLNFWACFPCGAWVGCKRRVEEIKGNRRLVITDGTEPRGRLANAELRSAMAAARDAFNPMWTSGRVDVKGAYSWLAHQLGIPREDCRIDDFDVARCLEVVQVCRRSAAAMRGRKT
jgi:hypothetical protein